MGQAAVDLPDPSELPAAPASSADDLLSQMAGDEIDRLLAEAEVEKGPPLPPPGATAPAPGELHPDDAVTAEQMDELFKDLSGEDGGESGAIEAESAATEAAIETPPASTAETSAAIDASAASLVDAPASEPIDSAIADPSAIARELDEALAKRAPAAPAEEKPPEPAPVEAETSTVEKNALTDAIESIDANEQPTSDDPGTLPVYLKPLVWLNAPMNLLPTETRDALGKIAILTLANAVAVLAYVMLFRRHH